MSKINIVFGLLLLSVVSGCVVAPVRPAYYAPAPVVYAAPCYHCWR